MVDFRLTRTNNIARKQQVSPTLAKLALNVSASQLKTWKRCKRLWWLQKVCGMKEREKQHFKIGHALHSVAELYISGVVTKWEELFPAGWDKGLEQDESMWIREVAALAVQDGVWQAIPGSFIEYPIAFLVGEEFTDARGLPLLARAETYLDDHGVRKIANLTALHDGSPLPAAWNRLPPFVGFVDHLDLWGTPPYVRDHKTAKHRGYAMTPKKLAEDLQVLTYAALPMVLRPDVDSVKIGHNVFLKNVDGPDSKRVYHVQADAPVDRVRQQWREVIATSQDMQLVRDAAPRVVDPLNPYRRADNWQRVKSAVEEGRPDACKEYGGCPAKNLCFGRCTAAQLMTQADSPDPLPLVKQAPGKSSPFGLNLKSRPTQAPPPRNASMPFAKPAPSIAIGSDGYVLDPENPQVQLRVRVRALSADGQSATVALYPNPDVLPDFDKLPGVYLQDVPASSLMMIPLATAKVCGYQQVLIDAGFKDGLDWQPAAAAGTAPVIAPGKKVPERPESDGKFGLKVGGQVVTPVAAQSTAAPAAPQQESAPTAPVKPLPSGAPSWAAGLRRGAKLVVAAEQMGSPKTVAFWSKLAGKQALVMEEPVPGDTEGSLLVDVMIDGAPYPDGNSWRFVPAEAAQSSAAPAAPQQKELPTDLRARAAALVGKHIGVVLFSTTALTNCVLEAADDTGITILGGKVKPWADVQSLDPMGRIPGAPPSKEEKAATKAAEKAQKQADKDAAKAEASAQKEAAVAQTSVEGTSPAPGVNAAGALDAAINAIQAALTGGKVTRKVLEGVLPLLQQAKEYQQSFGVVLAPGTHIAPGSQLGSKAPPLFSTPEVGKVLSDAQALISKAANMLLQAG